MLVQLSGVPGSGKSTLGRALARERGYVVLDTDVVKSALMEAGVAFVPAGRAAYLTVLAQARDLLAQGRRVVVDSPCRRRSLLETGRRIATDTGVRYGLLELWADDVATLLPRLEARAALPSQVTLARAAGGTPWEEGTVIATLAAWQRQMLRPPAGWLRLDAHAPVTENVRRAVAHLDALG